MALPRPMEVVNALKRLGYLDKPSIGDHISLFKLVADHPEGPVTVRVGVDCGHMSKKDLTRIRRDAHLKDDELWGRALKKKLPVDEYDRYLAGIPKADLVIAFFRPMFTKD